MLRKDIFELVKHVKSKRILAQVSTNGILLAEKSNAKKLVDSGVDVITVSLDCMDQGIYKKIRGVDRFNDTIQGIKNIVELKHKHKKTLNLNVNLVISDLNIDNMLEIITFIKKLGVEDLWYMFRVGETFG